MGMLAKLSEALRNCMPAIIAASAPATARHTLFEGELEQPVVFAEVVAASAFLDFGGVPDGRWFHALYAWRLSEAGGCSGDVSPVSIGLAPRPRVWPDSPENDLVGGRLVGRTNRLPLRRFEV